MTRVFLQQSGGCPIWLGAPNRRAAKAIVPEKKCQISRWENDGVGWTNSPNRGGLIAKFGAPRCKRGGPWQSFPKPSYMAAVRNEGTRQSLVAACQVYSSWCARGPGVTSSLQSHKVAEAGALHTRIRILRNECSFVSSTIIGGWAYSRVAFGLGFPAPELVEQAAPPCVTALVGPLHICSLKILIIRPIGR